MHDVLQQKASGLFRKRRARCILGMRTLTEIRNTADPSSQRPDPESMEAENVAEFWRVEGKHFYCIATLQTTTNRFLYDDRFSVASRSPKALMTAHHTLRSHFLRMDTSLSC